MRHCACIPYAHRVKTATPDPLRLVSERDPGGTDWLVSESDERRDLEQAEFGDELPPEDPDEEVIRREEGLAASEAASIGGDPGVELRDEQGDPIDEAERPLEEAGEGVAEGFEEAEAELIEEAEHGEGRPADLDAFPVEEDEDPATYGDADDVRPDEE
jgi:hypothetical protein